MLGQRHRRWTNIKAALAQRITVSGIGSWPAEPAEDISQRSLGVNLPPSPQPTAI